MIKYSGKEFIVETHHKALIDVIKNKYGVETVREKRILRIQ
jgi:hypothetical protein